MISFEEIQKYLPKYLSPASDEKLFSQLSQFPENIDKKSFYSFELKQEDILFQGDGMRELLIVNLPEKEVINAPAIILSTSCDIDPRNKRFFPSRIVYAPIFNLLKYKNKLLEKAGKSEAAIDQHIESIRKQEYTQIFYLPPGGDLPEESIVFLDRLYNLPTGIIEPNNIINMKLFTLSNYGHYVFLFKISIHFTRMTENIDRISE